MRSASTAVAASSCHRYLLLNPHNRSTAAIAPRISGAAVVSRIFCLAGIPVFAPKQSHKYTHRGTPAHPFSVARPTDRDRVTGMYLRWANRPFAGCSHGRELLTNIEVSPIVRTTV